LREKFPDPADHYDFVIFNSRNCHSCATALAQLILSPGFSCEKRKNAVVALLRSAQFRVI